MLIVRANAERMDEEQWREERELERVWARLGNLYVQQIRALIQSYMLHRPPQHAAAGGSSTTDRLGFISTRGENRNISRPLAQSNPGPASSKWSKERGSKQGLCIQSKEQNPSYIRTSTRFKAVIIIWRLHTTPSGKRQPCWCNYDVAEDALHTNKWSPDQKEINIYI
jgi:hypothetical protein